MLILITKTNETRIVCLAVPCVTVPAFDRKLAMMAPGAWMTVLGMKHPALNKILILGNLVFFGYLLHILVQHRREPAGVVVGTAPSSALGDVRSL